MIKNLGIENVNKNRRILIVDDEPFNIIGLKIILSQTEYQGIINITDEAYNGQQAVD